MKPTILIGLGGVGSATVDKIYSMMSEDQQQTTAIAALDTDIGDLKKLKNIKVKIQTSPDVTVGNYLYQHQETMQWFPHEFQSLRGMMLNIGAGQIRALSRLAFYSAIDRHDLNALDREIEKLSLVSDSQYKDSVNIVIVGTIAGGTCSGSFLQMGMYLRDYFSKRTPNASVFIQGVFLLPDVLKSTGTLPQTQHDNVQANAYSALKELHALLSPTITKKQDLYLEYKPGAVAPITYENRPYDNILFFDYENSKNLHLGSFSEYLSLLAETVYYAYISPISGNYQSKFVNEIREFISNHQESFYSASSVSKIIYPYKDLVEYLSLEWMIDEINQDWLEFDVLHSREMLEYKQDLNKGINRPKPSLRDIYIDNMDKIANEDSSRFKKAIYKQTRVLDDETGDVLDVKDSLFQTSIKEYIAKSLNTDKDFVKNKTRCTIQLNMLEDIDNAKQHITALEQCRKRFEKTADDIILKHKNIISQRIMSDFCDRDILTSDNKYKINHWVLPKNDTMHPVAVRYFLYKLEKSLTSKVQKLAKTIKTTDSFVNNYHKKYDIPTSRDTDDETYFETSEEVIGLISGQSLIDRILKVAKNDKSLQFKPFTEAFNEHYNKQILNIKKSIALKLEHQVYEKVLIQLNQMIKNWEQLFKLLQEDLMDDFKHLRNSSKNKHDEGKKDIYVFASPENKSKLWDDIKIDVQGELEDNTLSNAISESQLKLFCKQVSQQYSGIIDSDEEAQTNKDIFRNLLLDSYKKALVNDQETKINVSLSDSISLERRVTRDNKLTLENYIARLKLLNFPWVHVPAEKLVLTKFWGVNSTDNLGGKDNQGNPRINLDGNTIIDQNFPNNEIVYLVMFHNISVTDLAKFKVSKTIEGSTIEGAYFTAYHKLMKNIEENPLNHVTPHLDKRWDSPRFLPDLNHSVSSTTSQKHSESFLLGLTYDLLIKEKHDGIDCYYYKENKQLHALKQKGQMVEAGKWLDLYEALYETPSAISSINDYHENQMAAASENSKWLPQYDDFIKEIKSGNTMKKLITMLKSESKTESQRDHTLEVIKVFGDILMRYLSEGYGSLKQNSATNYYNKLKDELLAIPEFSKLDRVLKQLIENKLS